MDIIVSWVASQRRKYFYTLSMNIGSRHWQVFPVQNFAKPLYFVSKVTCNCNSQEQDVSSMPFSFQKLCQFNKWLIFQKIVVVVTKVNYTPIEWLISITRYSTSLCYCYTQFYNGQAPTRFTSTRRVLAQAVAVKYAQSWLVLLIQVFCFNNICCYLRYFY